MVVTTCIVATGKRLALPTTLFISALLTYLYFNGQSGVFITSDSEYDAIKLQALKRGLLLFQVVSDNL